MAEPSLSTGLLVWNSLTMYFPCPPAPRYSPQPARTGIPFHAEYGEYPRTSLHQPPGLMSHRMRPLKSPTHPPGSHLECFETASIAPFDTL